MPAKAGIQCLDSTPYTRWMLRSAPQPLQSRESQEAAPQTEEPLEFVDAKVPLMPFMLQHTKGRETAGHVMQLRPLRACLTAGQPELLLADPDHFLDLGAERIQATDLRSRQRQAMGGVGPWRRI